MQTEIEEFKAEREHLVEHLATRCGIRDRRVLAAVRRIPRHLFVEDSLAAQAYEDRALGIDLCQTISQPYMVARMTELADLSDTDRVLELGTGSGYQCAILASLAAEVFTVERLPELAVKASRVLEHLEIANVRVGVFDGTCGWIEHAPYAAVVVTAGAPDIPQCLVDQLAPGGRLVIPVGDERYQRLLRLIKRADRNTIEDHGGCVFVKLIGKYGWSHGRN